MPPLMVDAILFDMDGTLIDESESYREVIRLTAEFLLREPVAPSEVEEIKRVPGLNNDWDATWALIGKRRHGSVMVPDRADRGSFAYRQLQDVFQTYYLGDEQWCQLSGRESPFPWRAPLMLRERPLIAMETLAKIAGYHLGIATSRPRVEALMALRQHGLDRSISEHAVVGAEDAAFEKPHPAPLQVLVRRLDCRRPVYVGDTINDALAAFAAGMPFIHIGTEPLFDTEADQRVTHRVASVNEITELCALLHDEEAVSRV